MGVNRIAIRANRLGGIAIHETMSTNVSIPIGTAFRLFPLFW